MYVLSLIHKAPSDLGKFHFCGLSVNVKYRLGLVLVVVRPLGGLPGTAGALPLNFPFRHPAAAI